MPYIDFAELKSHVGIESVVAMLDIRLKKFGDQWRGRCPIHGGGNDREFVVTPRKGLYYCFGGCGGTGVASFLRRPRPSLPAIRCAERRPRHSPQTGKTHLASNGLNVSRRAHTRLHHAPSPAAPAGCPWIRRPLRTPDRRPPRAECGPLLDAIFANRQRDSATPQSGSRCRACRHVKLVAFLGVWS